MEVGSYWIRCSKMSQLHSYNNHLWPVSENNKNKPCLGMNSISYWWENTIYLSKPPQCQCTTQQSILDRSAVVGCMLWIKSLKWAYKLINSAGLLSLKFFIIMYLCACCVLGCEQRHVYAIVYVWKSEDNIRCGFSPLTLDSETG